MPTESQIERNFCRKLVDWAGDIPGLEIKILKLNVSGRRGWPDRLILWTGKNVLFVEFKRPGEHSRNLQVFVQKGLERMGFDVTEEDDTKEAFEYVKAAILATRVTNEGPQQASDGSRVQIVFEAGAGKDSRSS